MFHSKHKANAILLLIIFFSLVLRFWNLGGYPNSLYTDEINQGYNAYSILTTGKDEHGILLPISLRSFGDWKPPLSTYLMIPFIYILGLNELSVRLPSSILGVGTILLTFYLIRELFREKKEAAFIALLGSFFLAISPWHILQSRSSMLVMVGLFFLEAGIYLFIRAIGNKKFLYLSFLLLSLSIYAYYGLRVISPLIFFTLLYQWRKHIKLILKELVIGSLLGFIILVPIIFIYWQQPDVFLGRVKTISIFYDRGVKLRQWELISQDGMTYPPLLSRFFHNNVYRYGRDIMQRYLSHFDAYFLFFTGDKTAPFQIPNMGILYIADAVFILLGIIMLYKNKYKNKNLIVIWLAVSVIPASLTFITPSSNRSFTAVVPFIIFVSIGLIHFIKKTCRKPISIMLISFLYAISLGYFLYQYFIILPRNHAEWWSYQWSALGKYLSKIDNNFENIVIFNNYNMSYIYFLFFTRYDAAKYQKEAVRTYVADQYGFEHVESFGKYIFYNDLRWQDMKNHLESDTLYIVPVSDVDADMNFRKEILYPDGKIAFKIFYL